MSTATASVLPTWLALEQLTPFDAYAQAMGAAMLVVRSIKAITK